MAKLLGKDITYFNYALTSTTHKSCEALSVLQPVSGDLDIRTIHSLLGLVVYEDYSTGKVSLRPAKSGLTVLSNTILFVDECSMIDADLFNYIDRLTHNCKVVFIGDRYQLAPIKMVESPIYSYGIKEFSLSKIIRTDKEDLLTLNTLLRDAVKDNICKSIQCSENIIWLDDHDSKTEQWIQDYIVDENKDNHILCYTNKSVRNYNHAVNVLKNKSSEIIEGDEVILNDIAMASPVTNAQSFKDLGTSFELLNTDSFLRIEHINHNIQTYSFNLNGFTYFISYKNILIYSFAKQKYYKLNQLLDIPTHNDFLKNLKKVKQWGNYFTIKKYFADIRSTDSLTVHKAQGSTFNNVLIDLTDLGTCKNPEIFRRLLYVAISRAKNKVFLTGYLPRKYGEIYL